VKPDFCQKRLALTKTEGLRTWNRSTAYGINPTFSQTVISKRFVRRVGSGGPNRLPPEIYCRSRATMSVTIRSVKGNAVAGMQDAVISQANKFDDDGL
jgi:hypothetical protein